MGCSSIELVREIPEAMKPRKIDIDSGEATPLKSEPAEADQAEARGRGRPDRLTFSGNQKIRRRNLRRRICIAVW